VAAVRCLEAAAVVVVRRELRPPAVKSWMWPLKPLRPRPLHYHLRSSRCKMRGWNITAVLPPLTLTAAAVGIMMMMMMMMMGQTVAVAGLRRKGRMNKFSSSSGRSRWL
jgi:hypothetical protein